MSASRPIPKALWWLAGLIALAVASTMLAGVVLYLETQAAARRTAEGITGGDATAGRKLVAAYGCGGCHSIPGVAGAAGEVGPSLKGVAVRAHLAGKLPNDPDTMRRWLQHPQAISPGTGMPELGVSDRDARDMSAYLYTLKE